MEGKNIASPQEISRSVALYMAEWMSLHVKKDTAKPVTELQRWSPPDEGWVKANLDAGIVKHGDKGGGGMILWGHAGDIRAAAGYLFGTAKKKEHRESTSERIWNQVYDG